MKYNYDNETSSLHKLLLAHRKVSNVCKPFLNYSAINIKFSRT